MQTTMTLDASARCGQPIAPGEPAMQTAAVKETKLGNDTIYEFQRRVGTKGAFPHAQS